MNSEVYKKMSDYKIIIAKISKKVYGIMIAVT